MSSLFIKVHFPQKQKIPNNWNWNFFNLLFRTGTIYHKSQVLTNIGNCQCYMVLDFKRNLRSQFLFLFYVFSGWNFQSDFEI
jgi:hypothetical protein